MCRRETNSQGKVSVPPWKDEVALLLLGAKVPPFQLTCRCESLLIAQQEQFQFGLPRYSSEKHTDFVDAALHLRPDGPAAHCHTLSFKNACTPFASFRANVTAFSCPWHWPLSTLASMLALLRR